MKIQDEINLIFKGGEIGREDIQRCLISEKNDVEELVANVQTSLNNCVKIVYNSVASLRTTLTEEEQIGYGIINNAKNNISSCIENNPITHAISYLWNETETVFKELNEFVVLTNTAISKVQAITNQSIVDLRTCNINIHQVMIDSDTSVVKELKICGTNKNISSRTSNNLEDAIITLSKQPQLGI